MHLIDQVIRNDKSHQNKRTLSRMVMNFPLYDVSETIKIVGGCQKIIIITKMMQDLMEIKQCPLCIFPTLETKCVLFSITKKLKQLLNEYVPDFKEQDLKEQKNSQSFIQLTKIVFEDLLCLKSSCKQCNHQKIFRYMKRKLKCDSVAFQQLCDRFISKIGQRNYQFQVLTSQVKSLSDTAIKLFIQDKDNPGSIIKRSELIEIKEKSDKSEKKLIELCEKQQNNGGYNKKPQQNIQQQSQAINLSYQYFYPFGFYYV